MFFNLALEVVNMGNIAERVIVRSQGMEAFRFQRILEFLDKAGVWYPEGHEKFDAILSLKYFKLSK